jgi:hypothetical protein
VSVTAPVVAAPDDDDPEPLVEAPVAVLEDSPPRERAAGAWVFPFRATETAAARTPPATPGRSNCSFAPRESGWIAARVALAALCT